MPSGPVAAEHPTGSVTELDGNREAYYVNAKMTPPARTAGHYHPNALGRDGWKKRGGSEDRR